MKKTAENGRRQKRIRRFLTDGLLSPEEEFSLIREHYGIIKTETDKEAFLSEVTSLHPNIGTENLHQAFSILAEKEKKKRTTRIFLSILFILLIVLLVTGMEMMIQTGWNGFPPMKMILKIAINLCLIGLVLLTYFRKKDRYMTFMVFVFLFFAIGDITINFNMGIGGGFFALGHVLLMLCYLKESYRNKRTWILFIVSYLIFAGINLAFFNTNPKLLTIGFLVYSLVISLLLSSTTEERKSIQIGVFLFALSDALLMINYGMGNLAVFGHFARGVYYLAVIILSLTPRYQRRF